VIAASYVSYFIFTAVPFSKEVADGELWLPDRKSVV